MIPARAWRPRWLLSVLGSAATLALILTITLPRHSDVATLHGPWRATLADASGTRSVEMQLPSTFAAQGLPPNGRVVARRTVRLPPDPEPWAIHLEGARHAAAVRWDGVERARVGDPDDSGPGAARSESPLLAILPPDPVGGDHDLELVLHGDLHRGGLTGQIRIGPLPAVLRATQAEVAMRLGFALAFTLLAGLHLLGGIRRQPRWTEVWFGLFTLSLAAYAFEHSTSGLFFVEDPSWRFLARRVLVGGMIAFPVLFAAHFVFQGTRWAHRAYADTVAITVALSWLGPRWGQRMEMAQDLLALVCAAWLIGTAITALRRRVPGAHWLLIAVLVGGAGAVNEVLVTNGLMMGTRWLYPAVTVFLWFGSLAVIEHDRELSDRHLRLVSGTADAMLEVDAAGVVTQLNPAARRMLVDLQVGSDLVRWCGEEARPLITAHLSRATTGASRIEFSLPSGMVLESVGTPLEHGARLLVLRDVTRRRHAEDDLLQAARVETAGVLLGGIAHDFNNLLGTLLGHVGLLRMQTDDPATHGRLNRMEDAIERASLITRRLLAMGGRGDHAAVDVSLDQLLDDVVEFAEPALPATVRLEVSRPDESVTVRASEQDLRHILLNLILNARDAMADGGTIQVRAIIDDDAAHIEVADDGPGVPAALAEKIFEPFFTTKGPERGTGLGLPMAQRLARQHDGRLALMPSERGATFVLSLPRPTRTPIPVRHALGARVAVVDDEETMRVAFVEALRGFGYDAMGFASAADALVALAPRPPDVLVTDVVMPGMSGVELATALRDLHPALPVLIISGYVPAADRVPIGPPIEHLDKPVRADRVFEAIGRLLGSADAATRRTP